MPTWSTSPWMAGIAVTVLGACVWAGEPAKEKTLHLALRSQALQQDSGGHSCWEATVKPADFTPSQTAMILCDVWDKHWSRGATERVAELAPRMNEAVKAARSMGVTIIHAPSETMNFYKDTPARKRMIDAPRAPMPKPAAHVDPPQPIDASDGGSDTGEKSSYQAWTRQHPAIEIDQDKDGISDNGQEVWNFLQQKGIKNVLILGVHTNMCILGRSFAIKALVTRGVNVVLLRDLTDAMYNPAKPPYVNHWDGTRLVVEYIEKFWCPSAESKDILASAQAK